jgi:hypothetical protein
MTDCMTRGEGGCIYFNPSAQPVNLNIEQSSFINCFALAGMFLKVTYDQRTTEYQLTNITGSVVQQQFVPYTSFMGEIMK